MAHPSHPHDNIVDSDFPSIISALQVSPPKNSRDIIARLLKGDKPSQAADQNNKIRTEHNNSNTMDTSGDDNTSQDMMDTSFTMNDSFAQDDLMSEATGLARKLDSSLKKADNSPNIIQSNTPKINTRSVKKNKLSFSEETQFQGNGPAIPRKTVLSNKSSAASRTTTSPKPPNPTTRTATATPKDAPKKPPPPPRELVDDPEPEGLAPEPNEHQFSFVARFEVNVPACNSIPIKILNMLAYAISVYRRVDPSTTFLHLTDNDRQAGTIQEMPRFQEFYKNWAKFDHVMENFRNYRLDGNKTRRFTLSAVIGCNTPPKELIDDCFIDFDRDISAANGGGKITPEYKKLQVVDTNRNWILFGVPAYTHPESFGNMTRPILQDAMHAMSRKNPAKYPASKYGGSLPDFAICCMYVQNVPFELSKDLDNKAKRCIHFEIRSSDDEVFGNIFKYMGLSRRDKKYFGELARFFEGPGLEGTSAEKDNLGKMLQNHVAVTSSMGKVLLPGIMDIDRMIACRMSVDADGDERNDVHISLRRILMKQRINNPKVWQCILPNAKGGWEGYYANGFGCGEHKQKALLWSASVSSHIRFHLLKSGVLPESVAEFLHNVFTNTAAAEAFGAKLINGEVFTSGAATAASMSLAIQNSEWVDVSLGRAQVKSGDEVYTRPLIALQFNTDLAEHNMATDRNPAIQDAGSVAYSTSGDTTLGGLSVDIEGEIAEEVPHRLAPAIWRISYIHQNTYLCTQIVLMFNISYLYCFWFQLF